MTVQQLKDAWGREPFIRFRIHYLGGSAVEVMHPEYLSFSRTGRIAYASLPHDRLIYIDVALITAIENLRAADVQSAEA